MHKNKKNMICPRFHRLGNKVYNLKKQQQNNQIQLEEEQKFPNEAVQKEQFIKSAGLSDKQLTSLQNNMELENEQKNKKLDEAVQKVDDDVINYLGSDQVYNLVQRHIGDNLSINPALINQIGEYLYNKNPMTDGHLITAYMAIAQFITDCRNLKLNQKAIAFRRKQCTETIIQLLAQQDNIADQQINQEGLENLFTIFSKQVNELAPTLRIEVTQQRTQKLKRTYQDDQREQQQQQQQVEAPINSNYQCSSNIIEQKKKQKKLIKIIQLPTAQQIQQQPEEGGQPSKKIKQNQDQPVQQQQQQQQQQEESIIQEKKPPNDDDQGNGGNGGNGNGGNGDGNDQPIIMQDVSGLITADTIKRQVLQYIELECEQYRSSIKQHIINYVDELQVNDKGKQQDSIQKYPPLLLKVTSNQQTYMKFALERRDEQYQLKQAEYYSKQYGQQEEEEENEQDAYIEQQLQHYNTTVGGSFVEFYIMPSDRDQKVLMSPFDQTCLMTAEQYCRIATGGIPVQKCQTQQLEQVQEGMVINIDNVVCKRIEGANEKMQQQLDTLRNQILGQENQIKKEDIIYTGAVSAQSFQKKNEFYKNRIAKIVEEDKQKKEGNQLVLQEEDQTPHEKALQCVQNELYYTLEVNPDLAVGQSGRRYTYDGIDTNPYLATVEPGQRAKARSMFCLAPQIINDCVQQHIRKVQRQTLAQAMIQKQCWQLKPEKWEQFIEQRATNNNPDVMRLRNLWSNFNMVFYTLFHGYSYHFIQRVLETLGMSYHNIDGACKQGHPTARANNKRLQATCFRINIEPEAQIITRTSEVLESDFTFPTGNRAAVGLYSQQTMLKFLDNATYSNFSKHMSLNALFNFMYATSDQYNDQVFLSSVKQQALDSLKDELAELQALKDSGEQLTTAQQTSYNSIKSKNAAVQDKLVNQVMDRAVFNQVASKRLGESHVQWRGFVQNYLIKVMKMSRASVTMLGWASYKSVEGIFGIKNPDANLYTTLNYASEEIRQFQANLGRHDLLPSQSNKALYDKYTTQQAKMKNVINSAFEADNSMWLTFTNQVNLGIVTFTFKHPLLTSDNRITENQALAQRLFFEINIFNSIIQTVCSYWALIPMSFQPYILNSRGQKMQISYLLLYQYSQDFYHLTEAQQDFGNFLMQEMNFTYVEDNNAKKQKKYPESFFFECLSVARDPLIFAHYVSVAKHLHLHQVMPLVETLDAQFPQSQFWLDLFHPFRQTLGDILLFPYGVGRQSLITHNDNAPTTHAENQFGIKPIAEFWKYGALAMYDNVEQLEAFKNMYETVGDFQEADYYMSAFEQAAQAQTLVEQKINRELFESEEADYRNCGYAKDLSLVHVIIGYVHLSKYLNTTALATTQEQQGTAAYWQKYMPHKLSIIDRVLNQSLHTLAQQFFYCDMRTDPDYQSQPAIENLLKHNHSDIIQTKYYLMQYYIQASIPDFANNLSLEIATLLQLHSSLQNTIFHHDKRSNETFDIPVQVGSVYYFHTLESNLEIVYQDLAHNTPSKGFLLSWEHLFDSLAIDDKNFDPQFLVYTEKFYQFLLNTPILLYHDAESQQDVAYKQTYLQYAQQHQTYQSILTKITHAATTLYQAMVQTIQQQAQQLQDQPAQQQEPQLQIQQQQGGRGRGRGNYNNNNNNNKYSNYSYEPLQKKNFKK